MVFYPSYGSTVLVEVPYKDKAVEGKSFLQNYVDIFQIMLKTINIINAVKHKPNASVRLEPSHSSQSLSIVII